MDWMWPWIGCWLVFGVFLGAGIGLIIEREWAPGLTCIMVAGFAALGASMINDDR